MQLIYGNDGTNYRTIAKSQSMKPVQEKRLLEGYKKYDFVEDSTLYSSAAKEPTALTYVTTDLSGTLEKAQILLAYNARMTNYAAESSYAHFRFWDADKKTYGEDFLSLLSEGFVPDTELNKYNNENIDNFDEKRNYIPDTQALKGDVLIAAVKALLFAVDKKGCQVKITLDVEGDDYNTRALDVIASVYSCIPYNIRKKAGFCTYSSSDDNMPEQIKLIISPCSKGKKPDKIVVNLFRYGKCYKGNIADKEMDEQITRFAKIVVRKPEWRDKWFTICQEAFQLKNTSVKEHIELILRTHWWGKKKIEYIGDELAAYFYKEQKNIGDSIVSHFLNIVENRFKIDKEWFRTAIKEKLDSQNTFAFNQHMQEYIMLGEIVSQANFYPDDFLEWEQRKMLDPLVKDYPDERERYKELEKKLQELLELQKKPYGAEKYQKIDWEMKKRLERDLEELKGLIEKQIAEEKKVIERFIAEKDPVEENYKSVREQYEAIRFEENQSYFGEMLYKNMEEILNRLYLYVSYMKFMYLCKDILGKERYDELCRNTECSVAVIKPVRYYTNIRWNNRKDVWKSFIELSEDRQEQGTIISECKPASGGKAKQEGDKNVKLAIGDTAFETNYEDLMLIVKFLTGEGRQKCPDILKRNKQLIKALLDIGIFNFYHLPEIVSIPDRELRKHILNYYYNAPHYNIIKFTENMVNKLHEKKSVQTGECTVCPDSSEKKQILSDSDMMVDGSLSSLQRNKDKVSAGPNEQERLFDSKDVPDIGNVPISKGVPDSEDVPESENMCEQADAYESDSICGEDKEGKTDSEDKYGTEGMEWGIVKENLKILWYSLFIPMTLFLLTALLNHCYKLPDITALMIPEVMSAVAAIGISGILYYFMSHGRHANKVLLSCVIGFLIALPMSLLAWIIF